MVKKLFFLFFFNVNLDVFDFLDCMFVFDFFCCISVEEVFEYFYFVIWYDVSDEFDCLIIFNFDFEVIDDVNEMCKMIFSEVVNFRV